LVAAENWRTADQSRLLDCERYAYSACEVIAKNHYFGGAHVGPKVGYAVEEGDLLTHRSVLTEPWEFPAGMKQVAGHPHIITECAWTNPNLYQAEGPFLVAAYQSLTGLAGLFWFSVGNAPEYEDRMLKWGAATPMIAAQWPAASLLYRMGYVKQGAVVLHEERSLEDLWQRRKPLLIEYEGYDPNRDSGLRETSEPSGEASPLAFLVGRVEVAYGGRPDGTLIKNLADCIDLERKTVSSMTGEIVLDYGAGVCRLDTPKAQGVCGFLGGNGPFRLSTATIECENPYASILVVAMDDTPLAESRKVLIQVGTTARPTGWRTEATEVTPKNWTYAVPGERILEVGQAPWRVEATHVTLSLANPNLRVATLLDAGGGAVREIPGEHRDGLCRVVLPPEAMHAILSADTPDQERTR
jgi:hypothetical protein